MASIPQTPDIQNTYEYVASMIRAGKKESTIKETLMADGMNERRAQAVLNNLYQAKRGSVRNYLRLHPLLHRVESRLRGVIKR